MLREGEVILSDPSRADVRALFHEAADLRLRMRPQWRSENTCGWNLTSEVVPVGYDATVLVSPAHRAAILAAKGENRAATDPVAIPRSPLLAAAAGQRTALGADIQSAMAAGSAPGRPEAAPGGPFDLVHHLTWGGVRAPTFLGTLDAPLIIGPVGGGETSPGMLRDRFSLRGRVLETMRDLSNATIELNPSCDRVCATRG